VKQKKTYNLKRREEIYRARTSKLLKTTWRKWLLLSEAPMFCNQSCSVFYSFSVEVRKWRVWSEKVKREDKGERQRGLKGVRKVRKKMWESW